MRTRRPVWLMIPIVILIVLLFASRKPWVFFNDDKPLLSTAMNATPHTLSASEEVEQIVVTWHAPAAVSEETYSPSVPIPLPSHTGQPFTHESFLPDRVIVMGKLRTEDTSWVSEFLPDWQHAIYTVDDHTAIPHTTVNKGKEATPYLTYLVENYHTLPSLMVFLHSHQNGYPKAWHTDTPGYDNVKSVSWLNADFVFREGYANLRCNPIPGCPHEIQPFREPTRPAEESTEVAIAEAWEELFNNTDVPEVIATPCCAQFAVSREQVLERQLSDYKRYLDWLKNTPLPDEISGRVFEYTWHIIFGRDAVL